MASKQLQPVLTYVRGLSARGALGRLSDRDLLKRFATGRDDDAFSVVVERYANVVFGVCRRRLRDVQDAEDACQATFLVLARRAASIKKHEALGSWLHGVAYRVAEQLRRDIARRRGRERPVIDVPQADSSVDISWREVCAVLDEELDRLPARMRAPLVLCYLQGQTRDEAAQYLGWSEGTLRGRLQRGRQLLRVRLTRRGITLPVALVAATLAGGSEAGAAPAMLIIRTARAIAGAGTGAVPAAVLSTRVLTLTEGVLKTMWMTKAKTVAAVVMAAVMLGMGTGTWTYRTLAGSPQTETSLVDQPAADQAPPTRPVQASQQNTKTTRPPAEARPFGVLNEGHPAVQAVQFSPDGKRLAAGYSNGTVALWDVASQRQVASFPPPGARDRDPAIQALAFAPDGRTLAVGSKNYDVFLWDAGAGRLKGRLTALAESVVSLAYSPDGKQLAVGSAPAGLRVWFMPDRSSQLEIRGSAGGSVAFAPDGKRLASAGLDGTVQLWDVANARVFWRFEQGNKQAGPVIQNKRDLDRPGRGTSVAFSPDGKVLAIAAQTGQVLLLDAATGKAVRVLGTGQSGNARSFVFAFDGRTLAVSDGNSGLIRLWDATTGKEIGALNEPAVPVLSLAFAPDGKLLASVGGDGTIRLWALKKGQLSLSHNEVGRTPDSDRLGQLVHELGRSNRSLEQQIDALYLAALGRFPTETEQDFSKGRLATATDRGKGLAELLAMLTHTREFGTHVQSLAKHAVITNR
jgi:RNA polymerase sigma factor (sigma-70 family)